MARKDRPEPPSLEMPEPPGAEDSDEGGGSGGRGGGRGGRHSRVPALRYLRSRSSSSTSSSEFEFTVSLSPASRMSSSQLYCPADELFYKGQLLPLHLSPRLSMVKTLLLASSPSESASDTTSTSTAAGSRDSNGSSNDSTGSFSGDLLLIAAAAAAAECDSSRPSSVTEEDAAKARFHRGHHGRHSSSSSSSNKYLLSSLATRFSSVFHRHSKKDSQHLQDQLKQQEQPQPQPQSAPVLAQDDSCVLNNKNNNNNAETVTCYFSPLGSAGRRTSSASDATAAAREVIKKCVRKVKPFYEKISSLQHSNHTKQAPACNTDGSPAPKQHPHKKTFSFSIRRGGAGEKSTSSSKSAQILAAALRLRHSSNNKPVPELGILGEMVRNATDDEPGGTAGDRDMYPSSFSGNLRYPRKKRCSMAASCPSSMRSSPSHSGLLCPGGSAGRGSHVLLADRSAALPHAMSASSTSMEELQSAIQGAIAHCKNTMKKGPPESDRI